MISRRNALKAGFAGAIALSAARTVSQAQAAPALVSNRPAPKNRKFTSPAVDAYISAVQRRITDPELAWMFGNCFPNTLDTCVHFHESGENGKPDSFILTGDIAAMWLRDTTAELWPYIPLIESDPRLKLLFQGAIYRQSACLRLDPYANAFLEDPTQISIWATDDTIMKPGVHEHKWEIDSICFPIRLAHRYWKTTGDTSPFDAGWEEAMDLVVQTFKEQQRKDDHGPYYFQRGGPALDLSLESSYGVPIKPIGLIYSAFRPSDDHTVYPFLIPSNFFAVASLRQMAEMMHQIRHNDAKALAATALADEVEAALKQYAIQKNTNGDSVYVYEMDGLGNTLFMDDPNVPSLLSLPYLDICSNQDPVYIATRKFILSAANPWFMIGEYTGLGSPHTGPGMIWPIGVCMRGLTSSSESEVAAALANLKATHAGTGFMHESYDKDYPSNFTRPWFAWANSLFGEFIVHTLQEYPRLLTSSI